VVRCVVRVRSKWISTAEPYHLGFSQRYRFGFREPVPPFSTALSGWIRLRGDHPDFEPIYNSTYGTPQQWQPIGMRITFPHCHGRTVG
jgi:hypothetical protein